MAYILAVNSIPVTLKNAIGGKAKQITPTMWVLAILFILRYIFI